MANIKSAKKRINVIKTKTGINKSRKTEIKTYVNKFNTAIENGNIDEAKSLFNSIEKKISKAASKSTFHKKAASRKISTLSRQLNAAS